MYEELRTITAELTGPGAQFEVHTIERDGHQLKAFKNAPATLVELWKLTAGYGDADYLVFDDDRITYTEAHRIADSFAAWLQSRGVGVGDRVAISMRNYPEWLLAYWGALTAGATVVGMNAWWVPAEIAYGLEDSTPRVIVVDDERLERLNQIENLDPEMEIVTVRTDASEGTTRWSDIVATPPTPTDVEIESSADAAIFYTSGTTGRPKGAQLSHLAISNNVMSLAFANTAFPMAVAAAAPATDPAATPSPPNSDGLPPQLATLVVTPLFHVTANTCVALPYSLLGAKLVSMRKWDAGIALGLIERERIAAMSGVPVMSRELINHPDFDTTDTSSLASLGGGGAQIQPDLVEKINKVGGKTQASTGYGMTETSGIITANTTAFFADKPASAGPAMPNYEAKVVDAEGNECPTGEKGELLVKGVQVISGYLNRPEATASSIEDGWLRTGDIATIDEDGFIFLVDRAKDMVLRGGENVYCAEVEAALHHHDAIAECAVFAVPDERLGEEVGAAIHLVEGSTVTADDIRAFAADHIAKHMIPRYIWIMDEQLPQNASGKFLKRELRDQLDIKDAT